MSPPVPFWDTPFFSWVVLPILIFCARICDVSIGTIRIMVLSRGRKVLPPVLAFFEVLIWLLVIRQIFSRLDNVACFLAYAGGFAMGNYVGILLEERFAMGFEVIRVITREGGAQLIHGLREEGYGATCVNAQGATGDVHVIYTIINRKDHKKVVEIIQRFNPKAFYSVEDVKSVSPADFLVEKKPSFFDRLRSLREDE